MPLWHINKDELTKAVGEAAPCKEVRHETREVASVEGTRHVE